VTIGYHPVLTTTTIAPARTATGAIMLTGPTELRAEGEQDGG
jgi:hypothetical protein